MPSEHRQSDHSGMSSRITSRDLSSMLTHWLGTPPNGYLGSGYGADVKSLLQTPMAAGLADGLIAKARQDVPLLLTAPPDSVNVYADDRGMDVKQLVFEVGGELIQVDGGTSVSAAMNEAPAMDFVESPIDTVTQSGADLLNTLINKTMPADGYF